MNKFALRTALILCLLMLGAGEKRLFAQTTAAEAAPVATPEAVPVATPEAAPGTAAEATPVVAPGTAAEATPEAASEAAPEAEPTPQDTSTDEGETALPADNIINTATVAVFPAINTTGRADTVGEVAIVGPLLQSAVSNSTIGQFSVQAVTERVDDAGIPPEASSTQDTAYSLTSEILYDTSNNEYQLYLYLYDNSTERLVVSDQLVYVDTTAAQEFVPFLVDSALGRINKYDIYLQVIGNGSVEVDGTPGQSLSGSTAMRHIGEGESRLQAVSDTQFNGWTISYLDETGATVETSSTENSLSLNYSQDTYHLQSPSGDDLFGTISPIRIVADFTQENQEAGTGDQSVKPQWTVSLGYMPLIFIASGDRIFDNRFLPLGVDFGIDCMPWWNGWGKLGFGLYAGYNYLRRDDGDWIATGHHIPFELRFFYETPKSSNPRNPVIWRFGLGFGGAWTSKTSFNISIPDEEINSDSMDLRASIYVDANFYLNESLYLKAGLSGGVCFLQNNFFYIGMHGGIGYKF